MAAKLIVGLVAHDNPQGLIRSAACVFNQTWNGTKLLRIVDDGSTAATRRVIDRIVQRYGDVEVIRNERRLGTGRSRNQILEATGGDYLAWIDAGALWLPAKLEAQFRLLNDSALPRDLVIASCAAMHDPASDAANDLPPPGPSDRATLECFMYVRNALSTLLGHWSAWSRAGEFRDELQHVADEELGIRLALAGVQAVLPRTSHALCIVGETAGTSNGMREKEFDLVLRKHQAGIRRRFGRKAVRDYRRKGRAGAQRKARADARRFHTARRRLFLAPARGITLLDLHPTNPAVIAIVKLIDRFPAKAHSVLPGLVAFTTPPADGAAPGTPTAKLTTAERAVLVVCYAAITIRQFARAETLLADRIGDPGKAHPHLVERLAEVRVLNGSLEGAAALLEAGLRARPDGGRLRLALVDVLTRMSHWNAAIAHWELVHADLQATASVWTSIRVAEAYRMNGKVAEADNVARSAAKRHPENARLQNEIDLCRPGHIDWPNSLVGVESLRDEPATGAVEAKGFLVGGAGPVTGRLPVVAAVPEKIRLCVNGEAIVSTRAAAAPDGRGAMFSINGAALLQYLGDGDIVQILAEGNPVPIPGIGDAVMVLCGLPSRFSALMDKIEAGFVFDKFGQLRPGHDQRSKRQAVALFLDVSRLVESATGCPVFPFYGNLLGIVRESDFIVHDVGGFDATVLCRSSSPDEVKAEFVKICGMLLEHGYYLKLDPWGAMLRREPSSVTFLDLSYAWFTEDEDLHVSFGWRSSAARGRDGMVAFRTGYLAEHLVRIPGNSEDILVQLYGPQWQVPDQGFQVRRELRRDTTYLLQDIDIEPLARYFPDLVRRGRSF